MQCATSNHAMRHGWPPLVYTNYEIRADSGDVMKTNIFKRALTHYAQEVK